MSNSIIDRIRNLKEKRKAIILAHYYEEGAIQDIADFVGDSYQLALYGQKSDAPVILLAGVVFMAESVKILSPDKTVLFPDREAGCSLVASSPFEEYLAWKQSFPNPFLVTYINSSARVKAISDVIVTSSNAEKIISKVPHNKTILFGPDRNLGLYLKRQTGRPMELWPGTCEVHVLFSAQKLMKLMKEHPDARVIAHPECDEAILQLAHVVGSTSRLLAEVTRHPGRKFIVATETGIFHQMQKARPDAILIQAPNEKESCSCNDCPYMKLNTLQKIEAALMSLSPEITLPQDILTQARKPLELMMEWSQ
ncbi:MAG: quinolinate synthase NadA [Bdellovibrionaceae bacterium]|nr:quinolinate synthase NadA [Pseudobdellovibrionaceae bacterium]MDW8189706.1 quinolinate synthase NadA [Pseudobdellovibrionaceae bacterium]